MGKIHFVVEGTTVGPATVSGGVVKTFEVSEVDSARLITAYAKIYSGKWTNNDGSLRQPTIAEVIDAWASGVVAGSVAAVKSVEETEAANAAKNSVSQISVTA